MKTPYYTFLLALGISVLTGCTPVVLNKVQNPKVAWQKHRRQLQSLQCFTLNGLVGVSDNHHGQTADFYWQQHNRIYRIKLSGPLGIDARVLTNASGYVALISSKHIDKAKNAQALLKAKMNLNIPISGLQDWVKGVPVSSHNFTLNEYGYISHMRESGWKIQYLSYQSEKGIDLPKQMVLSRNLLKIVLSIHDWKKSC